MDASEYEELEQLFHYDARPLDFEHSETGTSASNLPEWLIGVIVVVILLIIVFFAMVIYSLVRERKKSRAGSYGATNSDTSPEEPQDVSKDDGCIRITSFIVDNEKENTNGWVDTEAATLQRRPQGRANPVFIDDDDNKKKNNKKSKPNDNNSTNNDNDNGSKVTEINNIEDVSNNVSSTKDDQDTKINVSAEVNTVGQPEDTTLSLTDENILEATGNETETTGANKDLSTNL